MRVLIADEGEARIVEARLRALAYCLGPTVELEVVLPDGRMLRHYRGGLTPAAQCASLNERMEDMLERWDQSRGSR
jgi:hypothetical protein